MAKLPWPVRALISTFWWFIGLSATLKIADMLLIREETAGTIWLVLFPLGVLVILVGEFATRHDAQGSGRPSQSS